MRVRLIPMNLTIEITVQSVEEYLQVLAVLDQAEENGELDFEFTARLALQSLRALAEHAMSGTCRLNGG